MNKKSFTWSETYNQSPPEIQQDISTWIARILLSIFSSKEGEDVVLEGNYENGLPDKETTTALISLLKKIPQERRFYRISIEEKFYPKELIYRGCEEITLLYYLFGRKKKLLFKITSGRFIKQVSNDSFDDKEALERLPVLLALTGDEKGALSLALVFHNYLDDMPFGTFSAFPYFKSACKYLDKISVASKDVMEVFFEAYKLASYIKNDLPSEHDIPGFLIIGETGTGKESLARFISEILSPGGFTALNCNGYESNILQAELFGTVKGRFTGVEDRPGLFEAAAGGTVFLDEIDGLESKSQGMLLRVLQERKVRRLGSAVDNDVNFFLICASNKPNLKVILAPDFYARISAFPLTIPPLRERKDDIIHIAQRFIAEHLSVRRQKRKPHIVEEDYRKIFVLAPSDLSDENGKTLPLDDLPPRKKELVKIIEKLTHKVVKRYIDCNLPPVEIYAIAEAQDIIEEAVPFLKKYNWPENVRELQNVLRRLFILSDGKKITKEIVNRYLKIDQEHSKPETREDQYPFKDLTLAQIEKKHIEEALVGRNGTLAEVAKYLGISVATLQRKRKEYDLK